MRSPLENAESNEEPAELYPGSLIRGRTGRAYAVVREIGAGGFARVFLVRSPDGRSYACKVFREPDDVERRARPSASVAMDHEWQALEKLRGSSLFPTPHDRGLVGALPFLIEDYVAGIPLRDVLDHFGVLDVGLVIELVDDLARGLNAAHARGVVHRDVASHNIMLTTSRRRGRTRIECRILDPGLARVHLRGDHRALSMMYSPGYTAPERLRLDHAPVAPSPAEDYFSLGAVAFESLRGSLPFGPFGPHNLPASGVRPNWVDSAVPPAVRALVNQLLAVEPTARAADFESLSDAMVRARQSAGGASATTRSWLEAAVEHRRVVDALVYESAPTRDADDQPPRPTGRADWFDALPLPVALGLGLCSGAVAMAAFSFTGPHQRLVAGLGLLAVVLGVAWRAQWVAVPTERRRGEPLEDVISAARGVGHAPDAPRPAARATARSNQPATICASRSSTRPMTVGVGTNGVGAQSGRQVGSTRPLGLAPPGGDTRAPPAESGAPRFTRVLSAHAVSIEQADATSDEQADATSEVEHAT